MKFQAIISDLLKKIKQTHRAEKMIAYISSRDDDVYIILHRIGWIKKSI